MGKKAFYRERNIFEIEVPHLYPHLLGTYKKEWTLISYIEGKTLFDISTALNIDIMKKLANWFLEFEKVHPGYIRGDAIPQNFILTEDKHIYGIDFEEAHKGDPLLDIAEFVAFLIAWKKLPQDKADILSSYFIQTYQKGKQENIKAPLIKYLHKFFKKFYHFRKKTDLLLMAENTNLIVDNLYSLFT